MKKGFKILVIGGGITVIAALIALLRKSRASILEDSMDYEERVLKKTKFRSGTPTRPLKNSPCFIKQWDSLNKIAKKSKLFAVDVVSGGEVVNIHFTSVMRKNISLTDCPYREYICRYDEPNKDGYHCNTCCYAYNTCFVELGDMALWEKPDSCAPDSNYSV